MNTVICFAGTGTAIEHTFQNLKEYLIDDIGNSDVIVFYNYPIVMLVL